MSVLACEWVSESDSAQETVVMLHGILGRRRNLFGFARRFVKTFPAYRALLVDIRNHGDSQGFNAPHTLDACAQDLRDLFAHLNTKPRSLIGHSFGAGVAFAYVKKFDDTHSLWLLDAIPAVDGKKTIDNSIDHILRSLDSNAKAASKKEFEADLLAKGIAPGLVSWLAMNLVPQGGGLQFRPDPKAAREMVEDLGRSYRIEDIKALKTNTFFIRAALNNSWRGAIEKPLSELVSAGRAMVFDLPNSGHFVHIDNPQGIIDAMKVDFA